MRLVELHGVLLPLPLLLSPGEVPELPPGRGETLPLEPPVAAQAREGEAALCLLLQFESLVLFSAVAGLRLRLSVAAGY